MKERRLTFVVAAGLLIAVVCVVRIATNRPQSYEAQVAAASVMRPAPGFEALDSDNHLVRLGAWLGRHQIVVVFFDGERGADQDANLLRLRERFSELNAPSVKIVGVTAVAPQVNRAAIERGGSFPFPLVSDIDPQNPEGTMRIHRHWGRLDSRSEKPVPGIFLIDRKGSVAYIGTTPKSYDNADQVIEQIKKS
jgi:peroxiredoxin